jgi:hypothetical protein
MNCPWYWYQAQDNRTGQQHTRIQAAPRDSVQAAVWCIPMRSWTSGRWNMYLQPWWKAAGISSHEIPILELLNCEWVCTERRRPPHYQCPKTCEHCYPPPSETTTCPCCGQEEQS